MKNFAVVYFEDEGVFSVRAHKVAEVNSLREGIKIVESKRLSELYAVVRNFDGDEMNANYCQQIYPESVE